MTNPDSYEFTELEKTLKKFQNKQNHFPYRKNYWAIYQTALNSLDKVYKDVNQGLSTYSEDKGRLYTDHGREHFDEVVKYADCLLSMPGKDQLKTGKVLNPYEIFLLLMGIRLHDTGNIDGRSGHEKRALDYLKQSIPKLLSDEIENSIIGKIAKAHGGRTPDDEKDTISHFLKINDSLCSVPFRPQMVASIVRFSDEICEHRGRSALTIRDLDKIPDLNKIFHLYAYSISSSTIDMSTKTLCLEFKLLTEHLLKKFPHPETPTKAKYLFDEVKSRLYKLDRERLYCNQFLPPDLQTGTIEVSIEIFNDYNDVEPVYQKNLKISQSGYPEEDSKWMKRYGLDSGTTIKAISKKERKEKGIK